MKCIVSTSCVLLCLVVADTFAAPVFPAQFSASTNLQVGGSATSGSSNSGGLGGLSEVLSTLDIPALLRSVNSVVKIVGVFCPPLSQVLDNVIQNVTSVAFRVFGRAILRNGLGGGGGGNASDAGSRVNVVLPTYPPFEDDDYEDDEESSASPGSDDNVDLRMSQSSTTPTSAQTDSASPASDDENTVAKRHVRLVREAAEEEEEDQNGAESAPEPSDDLSNVDADDADRNKRYSPFGGGHGSSGGGSGNFLFDIIRLIAGSGATEESDGHAGEAPGGVAEVDVAKGEVGAHGEGIPGPITRLFVVANRGLANLVQDLILRLAATSERIVNFKARLVTSLI